jgi:hypothetical protein
MKKYWRNGEENYGDENKVRVRAALLAELMRIIHEERHEAEPEYVEAVKAWRPDISPEDFATRKVR